MARGPRALHRRAPGAAAAVDRCGSAWEVEELGDALASLDQAIDKEVA
jgi:hypothetical protein